MCFLSLITYFTFNSLVKWYVTIAVKEENKGARKTQTLRMSMVMWKKCRMWYRTAEVIISPGETEQRRGVQVSLTLVPIKGQVCPLPNLTTLELYSQSFDIKQPRIKTHQLVVPFYPVLGFLPG